MRFRILCILIVSAVSLVQCHDLNATERDRVRERAFKYVRFFLSQRVDHSNPSQKSEKSITDLLDSETGRAELKAIGEFSMNFPSSAIPEDIKSSETRQAYLDYFTEQQDLLRQQFTTHLSLGLVRLWPRYYYEPNNSIVVLPEEISLEASIQDDFGPSIPELTNTSKSEPAFEHSTIWVSGTPQELRNPELYEINHVIPRLVLTRFYELFSATWNVAVDVTKRRMLSAPFRFLKTASTANVRASLGDAVGRSDANIDELKKFSAAYLDQDKDIGKFLLWSPGNLFFGFKNQVDKDSMRQGCEMIVGYDRYKMADSIYNRIMDLTNRADKEKSVISDDSLFTEMIEILFKFVVFGKTDFEPRPADWRHWEKDAVTRKWRLKSKKDFADVYDYHQLVARIQVPERDYRAPLFSALENGCPKLVNDKDLVVRSILTNQSDVVNVWREYFKKHPDRISGSLSDVKEFVSSELTENNWLWSRVEHLCELRGNDESVLSCDENSEPVNRTCPQVKMGKQVYVNTTSFTEWSSGRKFENKNQVTLDSMVIRVLTYGTGKPDSLNKKTYYDLYDEYKEFDGNESVDFVGYVNEQVQKFNSTASRILNGACEVYKKSLLSDNVKTG